LIALLPYSFARAGKNRAKMPLTMSAAYIALDELRKRHFMGAINDLTLSISALQRELFRDIQATFS
jgi:hypothetical protein